MCNHFKKDKPERPAYLLRLNDKVYLCRTIFVVTKQCKVSIGETVLYLETMPLEETRKRARMVVDDLMTFEIVG